MVLSRYELYRATLFIGMFPAYAEARKCMKNDVQARTQKQQDCMQSIVRETWPTMVRCVYLGNVPSDLIKPRKLLNKTQSATFIISLYFSCDNKKHSCNPELNQVCNFPYSPLLFSFATVWLSSPASRNALNPLPPLL